MRYYRRLLPFSALSFDLDDTLYSNFPVMMATDAKMQRYFSRVLPSGNYDYHFWSRFRSQALIELPELVHDVGELRRESYYRGIVFLGYSHQQADKLANDALRVFVEHRSDFAVPKSVHQLMEKLASRWPLVAISNGNVDTKTIDIAQYFTKIYHAGQGIKQKPAPDMFAMACDHLSIKATQLLHVGDCGINDIAGAIRFGCQTAWVSTYDIGEPIAALPTMELSDITELDRLIN